MIYYVILLGMTWIGAIASFFLKKASGSDGIVKMLTNWNLYIGGGLYLTAALLNIYILRVMDYSVVLPLTAFTYIWTMVLSYHFLREKITKKKIVGVTFVALGALLVAM